MTRTEGGEQPPARSSSLYWVRWFCVLPGAIAAYSLASLAIGLLEHVNRIVKSLRLRDDLSNPDWWVYLSCAAAGGFAFVYVGAAIAPSHRFPTSIALVVISVLFAAMSTVGELQLGLVGPLLSVAGSGLSILAAAGACFKVHEDTGRVAQ